MKVRLRGNRHPWEGTVQKTVDLSRVSLASVGPEVQTKTWEARGARSMVACQSDWGCRGKVVYKDPTGGAAFAKSGQIQFGFACPPSLAEATIGVGPGGPSTPSPDVSDEKPLKSRD